MLDSFQSANPGNSGFTWNPATNLNHKIHYLKNNPAETSLSFYEKLERHSRNIPKRIDYIFVGPKFRIKTGKIIVKSSSVVLDEVIDGVHASDHYGVFTELYLD
jgi:endonuclease/exonuclease/phosphatase family metal-dependent hydrolase